ncbi:hypothetical protein [Frondihabitans sucicola]|uniref:hypothetical protein n=1 Tax=Frondihabitans sucicola TaxID=1268041 RepID=UPI0025727568|nr:hypothetical protein [Frondihabitans sucicola]
MKDAVDTAETETETVDVDNTNQAKDDAKARTEAVADAKKRISAAYRKFNAQKDHFDTPKHLASWRDLVTIIESARAQGWPFNALGEMIGLSGEGVRVTSLRYRSHTDDETELPVVDFPVYQRPPRGKSPKPKTAARPVGVISPEEAEALKALGPIAKLAKGSTPLESDIRKKSEAFSKLVMELKDRNIKWADIADATEGSHTVAGLRMRVARHDHGDRWSVPPSIRAYRRVNIHDHPDRVDGKTEAQTTPKGAKATTAK